MIGKYWIEPKDRREAAERCPKPDDSCDATDGDDVPHQHVERMLPAMAANFNTAAAKSDWIQNSGFYYKDAFVQQVLESDYYW